MGEIDVAVASLGGWDQGPLITDVAFEAWERCFWACSDADGELFSVGGYFRQDFSDTFVIQTHHRQPIKRKMM